MFHSKITRRLVTSFLLIVLVSLSLLGILLLNYFRDYTMQQEKNALILNAKIIETSLEDQLYSRDVSGLHTTLQELHEKTDLRVTVIDADGAVLLAGPGMHGNADEGETLHLLGGSAEEFVLEVRVLAHARDNDSFVGLENLAGDARAWFVGRFRRLGIAIGHGKAEVTAFGILHDDMRALEMHGFCESREEFPQHLTEGFVGRQGHNNPVQRLKARLNIKRVRFFRHKKTHKRGKRPPGGECVPG